MLTSLEACIMSILRQEVSTCTSSKACSQRAYNCTDEDAFEARVETSRWRVCTYRLRGERSMIIAIILLFLPGKRLFICPGALVLVSFGQISSCPSPFLPCECGRKGFLKEHWGGIGGISKDCFSLWYYINSNLEQQLCHTNGHTQCCSLNRFLVFKKDISEADASFKCCKTKRSQSQIHSIIPFALLDESAFLWIFCYNYRASENLDCGT